MDKPFPDGCPPGTQCTSGGVSVHVIMGSPSHVSGVACTFLADTVIGDACMNVHGYGVLPD